MQNSVRVKICGVTSEQTAEQVAAAGADALGIVFYDKSPRSVMDLERARAIALACGPFVQVVGLFVNPDERFVLRVLESVPLGAIQFHGDESEAFCRSFARPYLKALRMKPDLDVTTAIAAYSSAAGILLDAYQPGVPGGTGATFDWQRVPSSAPRPIILAGGLTPDNVTEAIQRTRPYAVDVSGGVERSPGVKDIDRVRLFIRNAKSAVTPNSN